MCECCQALGGGFTTSHEDHETHEEDSNHRDTETQSYQRVARRRFAAAPRQ